MLLTEKAISHHHRENRWLKKSSNFLLRRWSQSNKFCFLSPQLLERITSYLCHSFCYSLVSVPLPFLFARFDLYLFDYSSTVFFLSSLILSLSSLLFLSSYIQTPLEFYMLTFTQTHTKRWAVWGNEKGKAALWWLWGSITGFTVWYYFCLHCCHVGFE